MLHPESAAGATFTGFAAYRATVDTDKMKADPSISWILETPNLNVWCVPLCSTKAPNR